MNFSKREWVFLILLLSLIQGFVWYAAFVNASNGSALNFISFAGTLISIILAILAIGYTYGESITQKNQSDTVVNQIEKLNTAIDTINKQTSNFNKIKDISDSLLKYTELVEHKINNTHDEVSNIKNLLSGIVTGPNVKINKSNDVNKNPNTNKNNFKEIENIRYPYSEVVFLSLIYCEGKHFDDVVSNELFKIINKVDFDYDVLDKKTFQAVLYTSMLLLMDILLALGWLTESTTENNDRIIKIDSKFKNVFLQKIDLNKDSNSDFIDGLKVKIFNAIENK